MGSEIEVTNEQIKRLKRGLTVMVDVDQEEMGVKKVLVIAAHPGTAELIRSLTKEAEVKSAPSVNMDYIAKMNSKEEATKVANGHYAPEVISRKFTGKATIPRSTSVDADIESYLTNAQKAKEEDNDNASQ